MKPALLAVIVLLLVACTDQSRAAWTKRIELNEGLTTVAYVEKYGLAKYPHRETVISGSMAVRVFFLRDFDLVLTSAAGTEGDDAKMFKTPAGPAHQYRGGTVKNLG